MLSLFSVHWVMYHTTPPPPPHFQSNQQGYYRLTDSYSLISVLFSSSDKETKGKASEAKGKAADSKTTKAAVKTTKTPGKSATTAKDKKETGKSLWVSNLSSVTRAADLKTRFSQYGKVRRFCSEVATGSVLMSL